MSNIVKYQTQKGEVSLSQQIVRKYLVSGDKSISDQEIEMFIQLCRYQSINPFLREAYLIKYKGKPAVTVTGKDLHVKRARRMKDYNGHKAWTEGDVPKMKGKAKLWVKGIDNPFEIEVDYEEYVQKHYDEKSKTWVVNQNWRKMPKTMLRKVALVQVLREGYPEDMAGLYCPEEMPLQDNNMLKEEPIDPEIIDAEFEQTESSEQAEMPEPVTEDEAPPHEDEDIPAEEGGEEYPPLANDFEEDLEAYIIPIGKHRGKKLSEPPETWLTWAEKAFRGSLGHDREKAHLRAMILREMDRRGLQPETA